MDLKQLKEAEYAKCADLLAALLDLDGEAKEKTHKCLQSMGMKGFFRQLESTDLSPETIDKLKTMQSIIEAVNEEGGQV